MHRIANTLKNDLLATIDRLDEEEPLDPDMLMAQLRVCVEDAIRLEDFFYGIHAFPDRPDDI